MKKKKRIIIEKVFRYFARTGILILGILLFIFSLLSGADRLGGGITGIIYNSPNSLPWLILLIFAYIAFRWEMLGGLLIFLMGVFSIFFFRDPKNPFVLFVISIPLIILGILFLISGYMKKLE